jgi:large subunit ribosomal protein L29
MSKKVDFIKSISTLNETDLQARIKEDELRMKKLKFAHAISPLENPQSIRTLRRDISRLKTGNSYKNNKIQSEEKTNRDIEIFSDTIS